LIGVMFVIQATNQR